MGNDFDAEMAAGKTSDSANLKLEDAIKADSWTIGGGEKSKDCPKWFKATPMSVTDGVLEFPSSGQQCEVTVMNGAMGYEDYYADVAEGTQGTFQISPKSGTLGRRGGNPQKFTINYLGNAPSGEVGHLVIMTEEEKWSYVLKVA